MNHTLLLRLPPPGEEDTEWLTIDEFGAAATSKQRGPLSLASAVARSAKVIVLAPATQILLAEPELPPGSGRETRTRSPVRARGAAHRGCRSIVFRLGRRRPNGHTPVAVVSRSVLQSWMAQLSAAGIEPTALYADISLVPENPGQTVLWLEKTRACGPQAGIAALRGRTYSRIRGTRCRRRDRGSARGSR